MKYTLVKPDGSIGQSREFDGAAPVLAPNKGRWLPDNPPAFGPATHVLNKVTPVAADATQIVYQIVPRPLPEVRAQKLAQLEQARKAAETASVTVAGKPFPATEEFQAKISRTLNYIGRGKPLNLDGAWRDSNAQSVNMNNALLGQLEDAITAQGVAAWLKYWTKFDAVMAAATVDDVNAVEW